MGSIAANVEQGSRTRLWTTLKALRAARLALDRTAVWLNASMWRCVVVIAVSYVPFVLMMAHTQKLSSDEIYTYRIAQQPTVGSMIQLSRQIDLHPPLHLWLQRAALMLQLPRWLGSRLPSLIAGLIGLLAVFGFFARAFRRQNLGNLTGLLAASVYWLTPATGFSWSNRPYALWLCLLALTALLWQLCGEWDRHGWVPWALGICGLAMVLDHMFGLPCLLPFLLAEVVRWLRRRQIVRVSLDTTEVFAPLRATQAMGVTPARLEALDPSLPIVVASATEFTELNDRESAAVTQRLYYLTDRDEALAYSGQTVFETEDKTAHLLGLAGHAEPMTAFLSEHPKFFVVGDYLSSEDWVLRYLMAHNAPIRYLGKYATTVRANDLYEVTTDEPKVASLR